jgi:hypothetical protein
MHLYAFSLAFPHRGQLWSFHMEFQGIRAEEPHCSDRQPPSPRLRYPVTLRIIPLLATKIRSLEVFESGEGCIVSFQAKSTPHRASAGTRPSRFPPILLRFRDLGGSALRRQ